MYVLCCVLLCTFTLCLFFSYCYACRRYLHVLTHSVPTRLSSDLLASDLAREGRPFRESDRQAADPARWAQVDPEASLAARVSPGAAAELRLEIGRAHV